MLAAALIALWSKWRVPEQALIGAGALVGLAIFFVHPTGV